MCVSLEFCRQLRKIELHAHLHGSIRESTLQEFISNELEVARNGGGDKEDVANLLSMAQMLSKRDAERSLKDCFKIFAIIHRVVVRREYIQRIVYEVLEDYESENCVYLELRTTPRAIPFDGLTKRDYVDIVVDSIRNFIDQPHRKIQVRLILSIDRRNTLEDAFDTVEIAYEHRNKFSDNNLICGIDFSGNPEVSSFHKVRKAFERARELGLKTTVHFAEIFDDADSEEILDFAPDRLGHACCLQGKLLQTMLSKRIPLEICPTSNLMTRPEIQTYADHPVGDFLESNHPLSICTDDRGVFRVDLTTEIFHVAKNFDLTAGEIETITNNAVDFAFVDNTTKDEIRKSLLR